MAGRGGVKYHLLESHLKALRLNRTDLCRLMGITYKSLDNYLYKPYEFLNLKQLHRLAGFLELTPMQLLYMLERQKLAYKKDNLIERDLYIERLKNDIDKEFPV